MCLQTKQNQPKIATKDIVCYKEVFSLDVESEILTSIYQGFDYKIGELYTTEISISNDINDDFYYEVNRGFHSWESKPRVRVGLTRVKCIIPAGSEYYEGIQHNGVKGYASNQIIVKEIIKPNLFERLWHSL